MLPCSNFNLESLISYVLNRVALSLAYTMYEFEVSTVTSLLSVHSPL